MSVEEYIRQNLSYNPETGIITWLTAGTFNRKPGVVAGGPLKQVCGKTYIRIKVKGKAYGAHNIAWLLTTGSWPTQLLDHKDGNGTNNKWDNLRDVSAEQNQRNRRLNSNNRSGVSGVIQRSPTRWEVQIKGDNKLKYIGSYPTLEEAKIARQRAEEQYGYHPNHGQERPL
jgi:hypothetical protein